MSSILIQCSDKYIKGRKKNPPERKGDYGRLQIQTFLVRSSETFFENLNLTNAHVSSIYSKPEQKYTQ